MSDVADVPAEARKVDKMSVLTFATREQMGLGAAADIASELRHLLAQQSIVRVIFAAAPSQKDMLSGLVASHGIDWSRVTAFHMDEYISLPPSAPQRFANWLKRHFFDHIPIGQMHLLTPEPEPHSAAASYAEELARAPIDIVCLGMGTNGHLAFNDPPAADFDDPMDVRIVELPSACQLQQVDDGAFATLAEVPSRALTLTIPRLLRSRRVFCVVPGKSKRQAVYETLYGDIDPRCPASILRTHPACQLYLDSDSDPDV